MKSIKLPETRTNARNNKAIKIAKYRQHEQRY